MAQPPNDPFAWVPAMNINAEDPSVQEYQRVLKWMSDRDLDRARGNARRFRNIPLTSVNPGWRRVNFVFTDSPTVSILIDETNSYTVAIRRGDGVWLKFTDCSVPGDANAATSIGFESSYFDLCRGIKREELVFGAPGMTHIYHVLVSFDPKLGLMNSKMKTQRKALVQLVVLFSEAVRFTRMRAELLEIMEGGQSVLLPSEMWPWVQKWSTSSTFALNCKLRDEADIVLDDAHLLGTVAELGINSREDVPSFLSLILHTVHVPNI